MMTGKEALMAISNGEEVEIRFNNTEGWHKVNKKDAYSFEIFLDERGTKFRLKPRTITINGIEVPVPFEPKEGDKYWVLSDDHIRGYVRQKLIFGEACLSFGAWRSEEEIKQVVAALRSIFK